MGKLHIEIGADSRRISAQHNDAIGQHDCLFDIVRHDEDGAGRHLLVEPQLKQFAAQVLGSEHVESGERFIHEKHFRFDHQGAGKTNALLHAAGKLFGICRLKTVEANRVEHTQGALAAFHGRHASRLQRGFDVFQNRKPGKQRKTLEDDGHVRRLIVASACRARTALRMKVAKARSECAAESICRSRKRPAGR